MAVNDANIQLKINKYSTAKYNLDKAIQQLEKAREILANKNYLESSTIDSIIKKVDQELSNLKDNRRKISNSINELTIKKNQNVSIDAIE